MMATTWVLSAGKHLKSRMEPVAEDEAAYFTDGRGNEWIAGELYTIVLMDPVKLYTIAV